MISYQLSVISVPFFLAKLSCQSAYPHQEVNFVLLLIYW
ncbi:hypothetical protein VL20_2315 [Microcystis panniformis FACHB-1757]|uniref:Uncharacterized protein n=1 Tax=Microcystis panniformis FACHB-1757 TaxID=1638788 RepID=A0A0K1S074_9CHRO|nr:hypothetical protein VL20_2315 [Microcystis panniformis FACHB-1757]